MNITGSIIKSMENMLQISEPIVYAHRDTRDLCMTVVSPGGMRRGGPGPDKRFNRPLVVGGVTLKNRHRGDEPMPPRKEEPASFPAVIIAPGSGFDGVKGTGMGIGEAVAYAERGFTAFMIEYRGSLLDDAHYPAYVQDIKEAVRFVRKNSERFGIDPDRIALQGASSGGNAVAMAGFTSGDPLFEIGENLDASSDVNAVVSFFGPVDPKYLFEDRLKEKKPLRPGETQYAFEAYEIYEDTFEEDIEGHLEESSVSSHIDPSRHMPALLYIVGDEDDIIPMEQGLRLCQNVRDAGGRAEFYRVIGAGHGGCFFNETADLIARFLKRFL